MVQGKRGELLVTKMIFSNEKPPPLEKVRNMFRKGRIQKSLTDWH